MKKIYALLLLFSFLGCHATAKVRQVPKAVKPCGIERWVVKTLTDSTYPEIDFDHVQEITVRELTEKEAPAHKPEDQRIKGVETTVWRVHAMLLGYKWERAKKLDQDFHLIIADPRKDKNDHWITMVAEIPAPQCAPSEYSDQFKNLRLLLTTMGKPKGTKVLWFDKPVPVVIEGVGFFDKIHGQDGVAPNGIELHPILKLEKDDEQDSGIQIPWTPVTQLRSGN